MANGWGDEESPQIFFKTSVIFSSVSFCVMHGSLVWLFTITCSYIVHYFKSFRACFNHIVELHVLFKEQIFHCQ